MTPTFAIITGPEIAVIVGLAVLLFGADRIPKLARSMGQAKKEFEAAQRGESAAGASPSDTSAPPPSATAPPSAPTQPPAAPQP
jgi:sec-independent protein translocase protein TatA